MSCYLYPERNNSGNNNNSLVKSMNRIFSIAIIVILPLSGCATKTPEKSSVTPTPVVVQPAPRALAPTPPASPPVRQAAVSADAPAVSAAATQAESATTTDQLRVQQCRRELDTLKLYNKASYDKYEAEFQVIASKTNKYVQVKDSISPDINDMVMPGYQFQIREFCFRVKTRLSQLVVRQVR
ncbi:hypothetical protein ALP29_201868 [Pseudomonas syringae pv. avii]|uniref:Uncharacterized protein n=1 Tax=Pseudomonas syringae pv. avii TaxID=663959 RepID=A0A3M5VNF3_PSESX|nr:hypothetical protein ALP43_200245 [Pseudomonas azotoformans]RMU59045.1 hypothetical protein ALP29_201868 [Pseudomonas syringae pv. avii]